MQLRACLSKVLETFRAQKDVLWLLCLHSDKDQRFKQAPGARFSNSPATVSRPKANFEIQTCWMVAQLMAHKPVNFASLTDSFIVLFSKLLKLWSWMQTQQTQNSFPAKKVTETFEKQSPDLTFSFADKRSD